MFGIENFGFFVVSAFVLIVVPGPAVLYITARSIEQGRMAGIVSTLGIGVGALVHIVAAALGISAILMSSSLAFSVVKYLGAAYLIYLGVRTLWQPAKVTDNASVVFEPQPLSRIFRQGVVVNVLNPKTALFFFAFIPQFVSPNAGSVTLQIIFLGVVFTMIAICSDSLYALFAGTLGNWLRNNAQFFKVQKWFSGIVYIFLGVLTAFSHTEAQAS
ncbi:MAG: LysE family translocator [Chloroflexota bacterium]